MATGTRKPSTRSHQRALVAFAQGLQPTGAEEVVSFAYPSKPDKQKRKTPRAAPGQSVRAPGALIVVQGASRLRALPANPADLKALRRTLAKAAKKARELEQLLQDPAIAPHASKLRGLPEFTAALLHAAAEAVNTRGQKRQPARDELVLRLAKDWADWFKVQPTPDGQFFVLVTEVCAKVGFSISRDALRRLLNKSGFAPVRQPLPPNTRRVRLM